MPAGKRRYNGRQPYKKYTVKKPQVRRKNALMPSSALGTNTVAPAPVGFYQGNIDGVVRRRSAKKFSKFDYGYRKEIEQYGSATGAAGLVRLAVKAYPCDDMLVGVYICILRYLLKKHYGYVYTNPDSFINATGALSGGRPDAIQIRYARDSGSGTRSIITHQVPTINIGNVTLRGAATNFAIQYLNQFQSSGTNPDQKDEYYPLDYRFVDNYGVTGEETPFFPLSGMKISLYGKAEVVIQNTSRHDTSTSEAIGFVDNNPICGNLVYLKGQTVEAQNLGIGTTTPSSNELGMNYVTTSDGVLFSEAVTGQMWRAVQPLKSFKRGVKQISGVNLDPGSSKTYNVFYKYNGLLSTYLMKYWPDTQNNGTITVEHRGTTSGFGGLNMIGLIQLEKRISTGLQPVRINYHVDFHIGCRVSRGPSQPRWNVDYDERNISRSAPTALMATENGNGVDDVEK